MSSKNWKPWWERVSDFDTPHEKEEFMKGIAGKRPATTSKGSAILIGVIAGYLGGKASQKGKK